MTLTVGRRLGPYEIVAPLGAGGMGEVYRARDTTLDRDVALKILPELFASDPERLARFEREAKTLASLNHPHIAQIYGLEQSGTTSALVMELVEGEDLAERIARGPIPIDDALAIAKQLAEALEAAHEQGIVHRDLKPANIKLRPDGTVKVLDFGLAKAVSSPEGLHYGEGDDVVHGFSPALVNSPTFTAMPTQMGVIVGTAAYMAPEQARGKMVDKRADIWAFGCVLYEMLSGLQAFGGETVTDILARVVEREPDWSKLPQDTPAAVRRVLRRCLEKDPKARLRDVADARFDLLETAPPAAAAGRRSTTSRRAIVLAAATAAVALAFVAGWLARRGDAPRLPTRTSIVIPEGHRIASGPAISRDGRLVAFTSTDGTAPPRLFVRSLDSFALREVQDSAGALQPFFSPDGRWLGFFARRQMFKVSVDGGAPVALADAPWPLGGSWSEAGTIVFTPTWNGGLYRIPASGGSAEPLTRPQATEKEYAYTWPRFLPGGKELLFSVWGSTFYVARLNIEAGERTKLAEPMWTSAAPAGAEHFIVGSQAGDVVACRLDGCGAPVSVLDRVHWSGTPGDGLFKFDVSHTGTLVVAPGDIVRRSIVTVDETGHDTTASATRQAYMSLALSPDGRNVALLYDGELWIEELERGARTPFWTEHRSGAAGWPTWSADGRRLFFATNHDGNWDLHVRHAGAAEGSEIVLRRELDQAPMSVAPDGTLAFTETRPGAGTDIWMLPPGGEPEPWLATSATEDLPRFSRDGTLVAYMSNQSGRHEIYVQRFRGPADRVPVSTNGGVHPAWSPSGDRLFYREGNYMMSAEVSGGPRLAVGKPRRLFDGGWRLPAEVPFAVLPDGKRFLMVKFDPEATPARVDVVFNWLDEMKKKVGR